MKLTLIGDPVLREKAGPVEQFDDSLRQTLDGMVKLMRKKSGVGLAAPQIGIKKRFFVVQVPGEEPLFFVNPEIIGTSMEMSDFEEGCLSVPGVMVIWRASFSMNTIISTAFCLLITLMKNSRQNIKKN